LHDTLTVTIGPGEGIEVRCVGWPVPEGRENLCWRAAEVFLEAALDLAGKVSIEVHKTLPPGGGLGGGSSDAAAVLVGLNRLTGEPLTDEGLVIEAARLGSDVAFFASGAGAALATGRGEILTPLPSAQDLPLVVVWPGEPVSTAWAYGLFEENDFTDGCQAQCLAAKMERGEPVKGDEALGFNAFLTPVAAQRPDVRDAMADLERAGAMKASLAGSGACVWGVFDNDEHAQSAADALRAEGRWAFATGPAHQGVAISDGTDS
jgi:4-diphosphocytidyl-2-C-methyl-D-erythritol kinase